MVVVVVVSAAKGEIAPIAALKVTGTENAGAAPVKLRVPGLMPLLSVPPNTKPLATANVPLLLKVGVAVIVVAPFQFTVVSGLPAVSTMNWKLIALLIDTGKVYVPFSTITVDPAAKELMAD